MAYLISPRRHIVAAVLLLLSLPACTSWQVGGPTPAAFVQREHPYYVRITRTNGTRIEMSKPVVRADTLVGTPGLGDTTRLIILFSDIQRIEASKYSGGRTAGVVMGAIGVMTVMWIADCSGRTGLDAIGCP